MKQAAARGLGRVYLFGFCWMGVLVMPVIVPFLTSRGVTMGDVVSLQAIYGATVVLLEIPTGYLCDRFGRVRILVCGAAGNAAGFLIFALAHGFAALACAEIVLGAAWSLVSGGDVALLYDLLDARGADRTDRRRALANYQLAQVLGEASAALLGGTIAAWSLQALAWANAAFATLPLAVALTLAAPRGSARLQASPLAGMAQAVRFTWGARHRRLVFLNLIVWGLSTYTAVWLLQPYWSGQGVPLRWFGVLWAGTLVTVGVVAKSAHLAERALRPRGVLLVIALAPVAGYAGMAATGGAFGIACGFLFYVSRGLNAVHLREAFNHALPPALRATANSLASGTLRFSFVLLGPLVGLLLDARGLATVLWTLGGVFSLAVLALAVPLLRAGAEEP